MEDEIQQYLWGAECMVGCPACPRKYDFQQWMALSSFEERLFSMPLKCYSSCRCLTH